MSRPDRNELSAELRRLHRRARAALEVGARLDADRRIAARILALPALADGGALGTYLPTDGEVDPNLAADELRGRGWRLHLPVIGDGRTMTFAPWDRDTPLRPNRYGIAEPTGSDTPVRPGDVDVVLVPCVAVDPTGARMGFGAGYYDRAFAPDPERTRTRLVGVVYDFQVVDSLPTAPWDVAMDLIVTDERTIDVSRQAAG